MRIAHVAQKLPGGIASFLSEVLPHQIERFGAENVLVVGGADERHHLPDLPDANFRAFASSKRGLFSLIRMAITVQWILRAYRPDIIHLHSSYAGALVRLPFLFVPRSRRPQIVYCSHGWAFEMAIPPLMKRVVARIERLLARCSDRILCISRHEFDSAVRYRLPKAKLALVYNGINPSVPPRGRPMEGFDPAKLNILFVGRVDRQKGYDVLLRAMAMLTDRPIHLHAIGGSIVSSGAETKVQLPNVTEHGWCDRARIPEYIDAADAVIMPSRWEGFGLVALEALRQERAVLASRVGALPEVVREGVAGHLFPPEDADAIARLLRTLDKQQLRALGPGARQWFLDGFTADRLNATLLGIYDELLSSETARAPVVVAAQAKA